MEKLMKLNRSFLKGTNLPLRINHKYLIYNRYIINNEENRI